MAALNDEVRGERPVGSRFKPNDRELVDYLYNKVNDNPVRDNYPVYSMDVYGDGEWRTLFETSAVEDTFYFYTPLKRRAEHDSRISRVAADGVWKNQHRPITIRDDDGEPIGSKCNFSFIPKEGFPEPRGTWVMHEYRLEGRHANNLDSNRHGLCRIRKKSRNGDDNGIPADYGRPEDEDTSQSFENWLRDVIVSPKN